MQLILIGTSFQEFPKKICDIPNDFFDGLVRRIAQVSKCFYIKTIVEEMFVEGFDENHVSLCSEVAKELDVAHILCDPGKANSEANGRSAERDLFAAEQRQIAWLSRIKKAEFPVLVVCEANHVDSFAKKCRGEKINVMLLERNWRP